jgi:hypothetical protein
MSQAIAATVRGSDLVFGRAFDEPSSSIYCPYRLAWSKATRARNEHKRYVFAPQPGNLTEAK